MAIIGKNNHNRVPPFHDRTEKIGGLIFKNHGVRAVGGAATGQESPDAVDNFLIGKNVEFDLEKELQEIENTELQIAKRGFLGDIWRTITGLVGNVFDKVIPFRALPEEDAFESDNVDVAFPDNIYKVELVDDEKINGDETDPEKDIQLVKRGWIRNIRKKVTDAVVGAAAGTLVKRGVPLWIDNQWVWPNNPLVVWTNNKRDSEPTNKLPKNNLPLLLKTLRLRPGTADEITKIVEELGENREFQDAMIEKVLEDKEDFEVATANGKGKRKCKLIGRRIVCRRV